MAAIKLLHIQLWVTMVSYASHFTWTHDVLADSYETQVFETGFPLPEAIDPNVHTFQDLVCHSRAFVDNSLLIRYMASTSRLMVTLPRAFGKSINLDMIKYFYQMEVDKATLKPIPREETKSYKTFEMGMMYCDGKFEKLKDTFLISGYKNERFFRQLGSVPVVRLNIGQPTLFESLKDVYEGVKEVIRETINDHSYIMNVSYANIDAKVKNCQNMFRSLEESLNSDTGDGNMMSDVIPQLIDLLYKIFDRKVFVIIDEYDAILNEVYFGTSTLNETEMTAVAAFFADFYNAIVKHNENVERVFMTGILRWQGGPTIFSSILDRMEFNTLSGGDAIHFYGMSNDNVLKLLTNAGSHDVFEKVVDHYGGYNFETRPNRTSKFNPYLISCFISQNGIPKEKNFWTQTSNTSAMLTHLIKYKNFNENFLLLISGRAIKLDAYKDIATFTIQDFETFSNVMLKAKQAHKYEWSSLESIRNRDNFGFNILRAIGYLTETNHRPFNYEESDINYEESEVSYFKNIWVKATNKEVLKALAIDYVSIFTGKPDENTARMSIQWTSLLEDCGNALTQVFQGPDPDFKQFAISFEQLINIFLNITCQIEDNGEKAYAKEDIFEKLLAAVINHSVYDIGIKRLETQHQFEYTNDTRRPDVVCQKHNGELFIFELKYCRGDRLNMEKIKDMLENGTTQASGYADWYLHGTDHHLYKAPNATVVVLLVTGYEKRVVLQTSTKLKNYSHSDGLTTGNYWPNSFHPLS
ncbi:uncharacterized protein LOC135834475 [Planococcus citri]|uniref:uncharacterized protein LOC135834475 n=1 Tax=Planococcus citri TaxID=170843 RepID=UPI0031F954A9